MLTLRAVRALQSADVILFDDLVATDILDFARREAKKMLVGKTGHKISCRQDDINALMISLAKAGRRVVRLKGGDPMLFGRADEELAACRAAGIAVEVVPGITTAQGAASRLLVSLTRRGQARRVQYITGHATINGRDAKLPADIDWSSIADPAVTTVVYMPIKTLPELVASAVRRRARSGNARGRRGTRDARRRARNRRDDRRSAGETRRRAAVRTGHRHDRARVSPNTLQPPR